MPRSIASANLDAMLQSELDNFTCPEDVREHGPATFNFSMTIDIHDPEAFYKSAIGHYVKDNLPPNLDIKDITPAVLQKLIGEGNIVIGGFLDGAVTQICDPGTFSAGACVQDSTADFVSVLEDPEPDGASFSP